MGVDNVEWEDNSHYLGEDCNRNIQKKRKEERDQEEKQKKNQIHQIMNAKCVKKKNVEFLLMCT